MISINFFGYLYLMTEIVPAESIVKNIYALLGHKNSDKIPTELQIGAGMWLVRVALWKLPSKADEVVLTDELVDKN